MKCGSKIKDTCGSLGSINVNIEDGEMVQIWLGGLASKFEAFRTPVCTRENTTSFFDLQSMLLVEENYAGASTSTHADNKMLYTEKDRPSRHGRRGESAHNRGDRHEQGQRHSGDPDNNSGPSGSRGSQGGAEDRQDKLVVQCWYCGKKGHKENVC